MTCYIENQIANYCNDVEPDFQCVICHSDDLHVNYQSNGDVANSTCNDCGHFTNCEPDY